MYKRYNTKKDPVRVVTASKKYADSLCRDRKFRESIIAVILTCNPKSKIPNSIKSIKHAPVFDVQFNDIDDKIIVSSNTSDFIVPNKDHVDSIICLSKSVICRNRKGVILCVSDNGIGRASACGIIVNCLIHKDGDEKIAVAKTMSENGSAVPNLRLIKIADTMLKKNGSLYREVVKF